MLNMRTTLFAGATATALLLAGCQNTPLYPEQQTGYTAPQSSQAPVNVTEYGYVTSIQPLPTAPAGSSGAGVVLGAVVGGLLGNQIGGGSGRTAATIAGAVGGGVAGNTIEQNMEAGQHPQAPGFRITIRTDNGQTRIYDVPNPGMLHINSRVQIRNGQISPIQ